jgi:hypothetical protein
MDANFRPGTTGKVIRTWRSVYPLPLVLHPGDAVEIGKADPQWPGWVWCTTADEQSGWVPEKFLLRTEDEHYGIALQAYDARELTVKRGDVLVLEGYESGWYWAMDQEGDTGWVPETHVEPEDIPIEPASPDEARDQQPTGA